MKNVILNVLNNYNVDLEEIKNVDKMCIDMPIYIINLNIDIYRKSIVKYMLKKMGINYTFVIVKKINEDTMNEIHHTNKNKKKMSSGVIGCCLSHLWCIRHAIKLKYNNFLILEDDIIFHKKFKEMFKRIKYKNYDMVQLGCCDFNLHKNLIDINLNGKLILYNPQHLALGAYGNIYNLNFAKIVFEEKINNFTEFDVNFNSYYNKYNIGVCYPNLITSELSTTNLGHSFSIFNKSQNIVFLKRCFKNFDYSDYHFIWVKFIEYCYKINEGNQIDDYPTIIKDFSKTYPEVSILIEDVLLNNNIEINGMNEILKTVKQTHNENDETI